MTDMYPVYRGMNSYPSQRNQMPSAQYYHPNWEAVSPPMKEDHSSSCTHGSWPHSYGYAVPMQCHNCCSHGQHPAYYNFRPPCSHIPPPPPPPPAYHHYYGGYPPYPQPYPMYYAPPPHYSMELPRHEYDKNGPGDQFHCCGCQNHSCHGKGRNNVKIEEHEPDADTKKSEPSFLAGPNAKFPYPLLWVPPEYTMNREQPKRLAENEANQQHDLPTGKKPQTQWRPAEKKTQDDGSSHQNVRSDERDPNSGYGWFPLDINKIKQLLEGGDAKQTHDQEISHKDENKRDVESKDRNKQSSYPIFWMPYDGKSEDPLKGQLEKPGGGMAVEDSPAFKVNPRKIEGSENGEEKQENTSGDSDGRNGTVGVDKRSKVVKTIPVKQLEESMPELSKKEKEHKQDVAKNITNAQSSSSAKKSKLPPICLRVDPPKKKTVNGTSRSPSPPGDKKRQDSDQSSLEKNCKQPHKEIQSKDAEDKTISQNKVELSNVVEDNKIGSEKLKDLAVGAEKKVEQQIDSNKQEDKTGDCRVQAQEPLAAKVGDLQLESKQEKKVMSETEAAITIQTAYRGHHVRRSEPIRKLKEIAEVHEDAMKLKRHLEDLESCTVIDDKEKAVTGETIMKLLLKLDMIQGLHQTVRDIRRSVAKELILLQEKLDSIVSQKSDTSASLTAVEEPSKDSGLVEGSEVIAKSAEAPVKDLSLDGHKPTKESEGSDLPPSQPLPCQDIVCGSESEEALEPSLVNLEPQSEFQDDNLVSSARSGSDVALASLGLNMEGDSAVSEVQEKSPMEFQESVANASSIQNSHNELGIENKDEVGNLLSELPREAVEESSATMGSNDDIEVQNDLLSGNNDQEENLLLELPEKVSEESLANVDTTEDSAVQIDNKVGSFEDEKMDILRELPADVIEDDEKDVQLTEQIQESSELPSFNEVKPQVDAERVEQEVDLQFNMPREVVPNCDGKELTEVETSGNMKKDQEVNHQMKRLEVGNEEGEVVVIEHDHVPLDISSKDTLAGQEAESNTCPRQCDIEPTEEGESRLQDVVEVLSQTDKGNEVTEGSSEMSNMECPSSTTLIMDASDQENKPETVEQECSNEEDGSSELSYEAQNSVRLDEKTEQADEKIIEENEKLKEMLEKLLAAGKEQQEVISSLNGKVKDLEKKLGRRKKVKSTKHPRVRILRPSCGKPANGSLGEQPMGIAS